MIIYKKIPEKFPAYLYVIHKKNEVIMEAFALNVKWKRLQ